MKADRIALLVVLAGCSSSHPLGGADASVGAGGDGGGDGTVEAGSSVEAGTADRTGADCGPPMPLIPCRTNSDCRSAYLICEPPKNETLEFCRDPDAGVDPSMNDCPIYPEAIGAPICPHSVQITSPVCEVRYLRPCVVDADCGPAGFTCVSSHCDDGAFKPCGSDSDCSPEWQCSVGCGCPGADAGTHCFPPFIVLRCPNCAPTPAP